jgi:hypothetical protein
VIAARLGTMITASIHFSQWFTWRPQGNTIKVRMDSRLMSHDLGLDKIHNMTFSECEIE